LLACNDRCDRNQRDRECNNWQPHLFLLIRATQKPLSNTVSFARAERSRDPSLLSSVSRVQCSLAPHTLHLAAMISSRQHSEPGASTSSQFAKVTKCKASDRKAGHNQSTLAAGGGCSRGQRMDHADLNERAGNEARGREQVSCARCAAKLHLFIEILDTRNGRTLRLFRCLCGEHVWGD
jgi:hypothetical protein